MQALIFTDLDGTLLEHDSYSIDPARGVLAKLAERDISPIFNSSKTCAEINELQQQLGLHCPFICENGAALHNFKEKSHDVQCKIFAAPIASWIGSVHNIREAGGFGFTGFSDWTAGEIAERTGLNEKEAGLAKQREYSEPILWQDSDAALAEFKSALESLELRLLEGGRFFSIQGRFDKSTAMYWLKNRDSNKGKTVIALGDSPNDCAMLDAADIAVIIKSAKSSRIHLDNPGQVIRTAEPGPQGWQSAMTEIIAQLETAITLPNQENKHG